MFWHRRPKKDDPLDRKQLLYYVQQDVGEDAFALVRLTWFAEGKPIGVMETKISDDREDLIPEFAEIVGEALRGGADVSIMCPEKAEALGIKEP